MSKRTTIDTGIRLYVFVTYCTYGRQEITAWRPRSVRARDFVIFREKKLCIAPRGASARV
jgi:hypothetical protein